MTRVRYLIDFKVVEDARRDQMLSVEEACELAGISRKSWYKAREGTAGRLVIRRLLEAFGLKQRVVVKGWEEGGSP